MTTTPTAAPARPDAYSAEANHTNLPIGWEMFVFGLAILSITNMVVAIVARLEEVDTVVIVVDVVLSVVFLADFFARLRQARDRRLYFTRGLGWLDLVSCVPFLRIARIVRIGRVIRKLRSEGGLQSTAGGPRGGPSIQLAARRGVRGHPGLGVRQPGDPGRGDPRSQREYQVGIRRALVFARHHVDRRLRRSISGVQPGSRDRCVHHPHRRRPLRDPHGFPRQRVPGALRRPRSRNRSRGPRAAMPPRQARRRRQSPTDA